MNNKEELINYKNLVTTFILSFFVPLIAHILDLYYGKDNVWDANRLFILYFSVLVWNIIYESILATLIRRGFYEKGWKLGDADAVYFVFISIPASLVVLEYNSIISMVILGISALVVVIIATTGKMKIKRETLVISGLMSLIMIPCYSQKQFQGIVLASG